ncbi:alpha/beta fold hydrolase [Haloprofundus sp. MHR1]|uniref:alpha/beta fold hydrolase n=1 Tax=Haloprofundus sp. MHR1 TaxID=2572921 RepID=UPI0010BF0EC3|nr:alpha/beta hydrolase [Haloprofundus sp. MHR1]QCJ48308.1 alpha/beta fold hydrolase [Haloprofundus sp. MHR1]
MRNRIDYGHLDGRHPYHRVGNGPRRLVVFPGLSDPLSGREPSRLVAELLANYAYRRYTDEYTVWVISRPRGMPAGHTTRDMAADYAEVVADIGSASILGLSMGGLVAQHFAADYPELTRRLVLGVSGCYVGQRGADTLGRWSSWAERGDWREILLDSVAVTYGGYRSLVYPPLLRLVGDASVPDPLVGSDVSVSCRACLEHDTRRRLVDVDAPTLVIGGAHDHFFTEEILRETAAGIPDGRLALLGGVGHGALEERRATADATIRRFLRDRSEAVAQLD